MPPRKDYTGTRYGKLTAIHFVRENPEKKGLYTWKFRCDCGREVERLITSIIRMAYGGQTPNCGSRECRTPRIGVRHPKRVVDLTGRKFGKLTALSSTGKRGKSGNVIWLFQCECGKIVERDSRATIHNAKRGSIPNCGSSECNFVKKLPKGAGARNSLVGGYRRSARKRNLVFDLSDKELDALFSGNCFYCGSKPSSIYYKVTNNGPFIYNGIDRVDSTIGYVSGNVVSCCWRCNRAKSDMSFDEFMQWIKNLKENSDEWLPKSDCLDMPK